MICENNSEEPPLIKEGRVYGKVCYQKDGTQPGYID